MRYAEMALPLFAGTVQVSWTPRRLDLVAVSAGAPGTPADAVTVRATLVAWVAEVALPVIVTVDDDAAADEAAVNVRVELPPADTVAGLKLAVTPLGRPLAARDTVSALPDVIAVLIVDVPAEPAATVSVAGAAAIEKSLVATLPQDGNLKDAIRVFQLNDPLDGMYSFVYQKVQSSVGSTAMEL
jgi:hypothetical protein